MCYENIEKSLFKLLLKDRCPQSFIFYGKNYNERKRILKEILGKEIEQKGSFVCDKYLRFDFNYLNKLTDIIIVNIVNKIPDELLTDKHKQYIIYYLKKRRDILLNIK